jgi:ferrochelatase
MPPRDRAGLLLVNLGTPDSPKTPDVRRYLREFLSDPRVIDIGAFRRWLLLNLIILPFRPARSAEAYEKIWTGRGSPLLFHTRDLAAKVQARCGDGVVVEVAMRYGHPSIPEALGRFRAEGVDRIVVFPLYPQYSSAATGSSIERVASVASKPWNTPFLQIVPPFYDHRAFIDACLAVARPVFQEEPWERVLFSFHGLPERHCRKSDESGAHCLASATCCDRIVEANRNCYRAQCFSTAAAIAAGLGIPEERRIVCFQSRLGRTPWIRPYTDEVVVDLAKGGVKRALILSSAFVADCLETIEELGIRAAASFKAAGGGSFVWCRLSMPTIGGRTASSPGVRLSHGCGSRRRRGITGLAAAHRLVGPAWRTSSFSKLKERRGQIRTERHGEYLFEGGPDAGGAEAGRRGPVRADRPRDELRDLTARGAGTQIWHAGACIACRRVS